MGLIGDIFTGLGSRDAAKKAASDQVYAENQAGKLIGQTGAGAQDALNNIMGAVQSDLSPFQSAGAASLSTMGRAASSLPGYTAALPDAAPNPGGAYAVTSSPSATTSADPNFHYDAKSMMNDPSYQFRLNQGTTTLAQQLNAQGITGGPAAEALTKFATDYAGTEYAQDYARQQGTAQQNFTNTLAENNSNFSNTLAENNSNFSNLGTQAAATYARAASNYGLGENTLNTNNNSLWARLSDLSKLGLSGTQTLDQLRSTHAGQMADVITNTGVRQANTIEGLGNALASGSVASANAMSQLNGNITNDLSFGLSQLSKGGGSGGDSGGSGGGTLATIAKYAGLLGL